MLAAQGCASRGCRSGVLGHEPLDRVGAEPTAAARREQRVVWVAGLLAQHGNGLGGQRRGPFLAALTVTAHVRTGIQPQVSAGEPSDLGDSEPGLRGESEQGVVPSTMLAGPVGCG